MAAATSRRGTNDRVFASSQLFRGLIAPRGESNIRGWLPRFRRLLSTPGRRATGSPRCRVAELLLPGRPGAGRLPGKDPLDRCHTNAVVFTLYLLLKGQDMTPVDPPITLTALIPLDGVDRCQCGGTTFTETDPTADDYIYVCDDCGDRILVLWLSAYDTNEDSDWFAHDSLVDALARVMEWRQDDRFAGWLFSTEWASVFVTRVTVRQSLNDEDYNLLWDREHTPEGADLVFLKR